MNFKISSVSIKHSLFKDRHRRILVADGLPEINGDQSILPLRLTTGVFSLRRALF